MANKIKASNIDTNAITADSISYPLTTFSSTGIDDNATSTTITIDSSNNVGIGTGNFSLGTLPSGTSSSSYRQAQIYNSFITDSGGTNSAFQLLQNAYVGSGNNNYATVGSGISHSNRIMMTSGVISFARAYPVTADSQITYNESMRIDASGRVGIGTSSPDAKLELAATNSSGAANVLRFTDTDTGTTANQKFGAIEFNSSDSGNTGIGGAIDAISEDFDANTAIRILTGAPGSASERLRITSAGNVGIGTTGPSSKLHVNGNFTSTGIDDNATSTSLTIASDGKTTLDATNETPLFVHHSDGSTVKLGFGNNSSNSLDIGFIDSDFVVNSNGSERMRIDSSGRVFVGLTAIPTSNQAGVALTQDGVIYTSRSSDATLSHHAFFNTNGEVGNIRTSGSSTAYNTSSDYRLKENVNYDFDATTRLKQLKPARFNFIANADTTVDGFLAHEVSSVVPEAITGEKDAVQVWQEGEELPEGVSVGDNKLDGEGNTIPVYQGIDQSKLVPLLVKTIQELEARITALENE